MQMITEFGRMADGRAVQAIDLRGGALSVRLLTLGSALQDVRVQGVAHGLTLGLRSVADYQAPGGQWFGTLVGPVANRLAGAAAPLDCRVLALTPNEGPNLLHSGPGGLHGRLWQIKDHRDDRVTLALHLADGEDGFPGNRRITARWTVAAPATLRLELQAETDAPTLFNAANHSYWNLDGTPNWAGHHLRIAATGWLPTGPDLLPTGEVAPMAGAMDFRSPRTPLPGDPPLDTNFCLAPARRDLTPVLWLTGRSGLRMELATTEPGMQVYDGRGAIRPGGGPYEGLAIEPQGWPDAPNRAGFPSIRLDPGLPALQVTEWRFCR